MMTKISRDQAHALAQLVTTLRPDWDTPGIVKALSGARDRGTAWDLAHAALYAAQDTTVRTPAVIGMAGEHWMRGKGLGQTTSTTTGRYARCELEGHEHEAAHACRICRSEALEAAVQGAHLVERVPVVAADRVAEILAGVVSNGSGSNR